MTHSDTPGPRGDASNPDPAAAGAAITPAGFRVRRAVPADAREIARIGIAGWRAAYAALMPAEFLARLSVNARALAWRTNLEQQEADRAPVWVAEFDDSIVGYVSSGPPRDEDLGPDAQTIGEIYAFYVDPVRWRSGVGRALFATAAAEWRARGAIDLVLWVLEGNGPARAFYEVLGMRPDGAHQTLNMGDFSVPEVRYRLALAEADTSASASLPASVPYP